MLERFIERVSLSEYRHQLILKGGLLISNMIGIEARSTMDLDATVRGVRLTEKELTKMLNKILAIPVDDGVRMTLLGFENIRDNADYTGIRVSIEAVLERTRQVLKIDITAILRVITFQWDRVVGNYLLCFLYNPPVDAC